MREILSNRGSTILVDTEDYQYLSRFRWTEMTVGRTSYVCAFINGHSILMHRVVTQAKRGQSVDHINGNGLDNRKENLRICSHRQNLANQRLSLGNTLGFKGIRRNKKKWSGQAKVNQKMYHLGTYETKEEAARAYDEFMEKHYGEFAMTNKKLGLLP